MKATAEMVSPDRSHWLASDHAGLSKEELYPVLSVTLPRVGTVEVRYSVDRYRHSSGWSDWRMHPKEFEPSKGIGDYHSPTNRAIREACDPIIKAWLASPDYRNARKRAAAYMVKRILEDNPTAEYGIRRMREALAEHGAELTSADRQRFARAVDHFEKAGKLLA